MIHIDQLYKKHRIRVMLAITLGYGFIYTCRLGLSIVKIQSSSKTAIVENSLFELSELVKKNSYEQYSKT